MIEMPTLKYASTSRKRYIIALFILTFVVLSGIMATQVMYLGYTYKGVTHIYGTVSNTNNACGADGDCTITVNGKTIITGCGFVFDDKECPLGPSPRSDSDTQLIVPSMGGIWNIGDRVKVRAIESHSIDSDGQYHLHCESCGISKAGWSPFF